jgi:hypothetical protein
VRWPDGAQRGRLAGRDGGVVPVSEVVLAFTFEPVLWVLTWLRRWVPVLARLGRTIEGMARRAGGAEAGVPRWQRAAALASIIFFRSPAPAVGCRPGYLVHGRTGGDPNVYKSDVSQRATALCVPR